MSQGVNMSLEKWLVWADRAYFGFGIVAAIATSLTVAAGLAQYCLNARISEQKDRDLAAYQADAASKASVANAEIAKLGLESEQVRNDNLRLSLRLAELTTPRAIDAEAVTAAAKDFTGTRFDVSVFAPDPEAEGLAVQIDDALLKAGWIALDWNAGVLTITRPGKRSWGTNTGVGAGVLVDTPGGNPAVSAVVAAIRQTLTIPGFAFQSSNGAPIVLGNPGAVHFVIGKKPVKPE